MQNNYNQIRIQLSRSHATTTGVAQLVNSSGIGAMLDQVFLDEPVGSNQPSIHFRDGIPLGASVSQKLHKKIDTTYNLLDNKEELLLVTITSGLINLHRGQKSKYSLTFNQWVDAKLSQEGVDLLTYCLMITEMQYLHGDNAFRFYDIQFRKLVESVSIPW